MSRNYFEHDIRIPTTSKYKPAIAMGRQRKFQHPKGFPGNKSRGVDGDGDVDMSGSHVVTAAVRRYNPYSQRSQNNRKKHRRHPGSKSKRDDQLHADGDAWYKITVPYGKKSGKTFILSNIKSLCKVPFNPYNFQFIGSAAEFYVNDYAVACHIKDIHRRITTPDGFKLNVLMTRSSPPLSVIDPEISEIMKVCMSSRYDAVTHSLNLSKFHHDESLKTQMLYLPLSKPQIFAAVVKIIKEHIPELTALDLSENKLYTLDCMSVLVPVCKQLKILNLRKNRIRSMSELNHLRGLDIQDVFLDGNPVCDNFKDHTSYISVLRDRFPKLVRLDGLELPAPIGFDLGPESVPPSKKSFFLAEDVKDMVIQFLDQYYTIYDSGDRSRLLEAYHDQACFSLSLSRHSQKVNGGSFGAYITDNRNLLRVTDHVSRFKLLKQGKLSVVTALSELPQTMHDPSSFSVDIFHISPGLMSFSVIGVFKEVGADINNATLKTFSRTYVVVAQGQGFVILNETLFIAHASQDQQSKAFKVPAPTPSPSPAPSTDEKSASEKQLLVIEMSKQTGMNLDFSAKCLEENDWDYQRAVAVFLKFQSEGKLPPEAFINV